MTSVVTGLWQLAVAVMIWAHISASLPSLERHQRQIELKLMHDAGMRREYEKAAKLLQTLMNYKRSIPNTSGAKDDSAFDEDIRDSWSPEDKLFKLKMCLQNGQNLDASFSDQATNYEVQSFIHSVCQLITEMNEVASGAAIDGSQE